MAIANYASHLSDVGHYSKALDLSNTALEIRKRLAAISPERYQVDLGASLVNCANALSDFGRKLEATDHAKLAEKIFRDLASSLPDSHDGHHALSLGVLASCLSDVGDFAAALQSARDSLALYSRLAARSAAEYQDDEYRSLCFVVLLSWSSGQTAQEEKALGKEIPESVPVHRRPSLATNMAFALACVAEAPANRIDAFARVISLWPSLNLKDRRECENLMFCASAYLDNAKSLKIPPDDWAPRWREFLSRRDGNIPEWMQQIAHRLAFIWPSNDLNIPRSDAGGTK
jgi:tetratricopeptide (TPR) repeat protein